MADTLLQHTPGPWKWDGYALVPEKRDPDQHAVHTIMEIGSFAYGFISAQYKEVAQEDDANRALIAAAPELLKAAQQVYSEMSTHGQVTMVTWELLSAAIGKATGAQ